MMDDAGVKLNDVVDDVITLKNVAKMLNIVEVRSGGDELEINADGWVCPVVDVHLLDGDVIEDEVDVR